MKKKIDWIEMIDYKKVTNEFICDYPDTDWDWNKIKIPLNFTSNFIKKNPKCTCYNFDWWKISNRIFITEDFIIRYQRYFKNIHWYNILRNNNKFIDLYLKYGKKQDRCRHILSRYCKLKFIEKYKEINWCYRQLSENPLITDDYVRKNIKKDWSKKRLETIKMKEIMTWMMCKKLNPDLELLVCEYL